MFTLTGNHHGIPFIVLHPLHCLQKILVRAPSQRYATSSYARPRASQHPTVTPTTRPAASRRNAKVQSPGGVWSSARGHGNAQTSAPTGSSNSIRPWPKNPENAPYSTPPVSTTDNPASSSAQRYRPVTSVAPTSSQERRHVLKFSCGRSIQSPSSVNRSRVA